ncbi:MAG: polysaccharide pyruvyl transferase family protein, partial [Candidatus Bipolaricaulis sp.]|nr:polysaccharide pyruvyl transferase family protein [Candidatus Bipolaricaulis sp.]
MKILVIGQCTLHWGRMEHGNIGNYYIIEPFFRELHRVFPTATIVTTMQMTDRFCKEEKISCVPMEYYYGWKDNDLEIAEKEFGIATIYHETGKLIDTTPYIEEILNSDLVIDFSGDIWGVNADLVGKNRFLVGLLKDRVAQLLGIKTAMLAGSPGPFKNDNLLPFAKTVYENFTLVTNREELSREVLETNGFNLDKTKDLACPAFMFEASEREKIISYIENTPILTSKKPTIGFILCGWNMPTAPFDKWPREDSEFNVFIDAIKYIINQFDVNVCLMSHSNGFELPPNFKLIHGRDYVFAEKLYKLLNKTEISDSVFILDEIYSPAETKAIIREFDMLVSGRVHGAVAGLSQAIPTVIIDYGHEPKAHKLMGFAKVAGIEEYVANPTDYPDL